MSAPNIQPEPVHPRAAFHHPNFRYFAAARFLGTVGWQMQSVVVAWQVYAITNKPLHLGLVGLMHFLPAFLLALVTGQVADRVPRRRILVVCYGVTGACSLVLAVMAWRGIATVLPIYAVLLVIGTARAFAGPAGSALLPTLVPLRHFGNAVAWSASIWQAAMIAGPSLGGLAYAKAGGAAPVLLLDAILCLASAALIRRVDAVPALAVAKRVSWNTVLAGIRYIRTRRALLGAISMDMVAVLLGGAVALLPVYAKDVLNVGAEGLGILRGAPAVGAVAMAVTLAHLPPLRRAGATMLVCVAAFGAATIVFGLSTSFIVSLVALVALGAFDMVSVVVRHTLVQVLTPDDKRGRVSAVEQVFIGASNELGEFESGITAHWFAMIPIVASGELLGRGAGEVNGAVIAVVVGGCGTLLVVALWAWLFPELRKFDRLDVRQVPEEAQDEGGTTRGHD